MKILNEQIEYPQAGDKFFIESGAEDEISNIRTPFQEFGDYAYSYQTGALTLLDAAFQKLIIEISIYIQRFF